MDLGEIVAHLKADTSQFTGGIEQANKSLDSMKKEFSGVETPLNATGLGLVSLGGKITAAATAMGALGVAAAKEMGSFAEEMEMTSQKTGVSVETLQKWNFALNRVGLEVGNLMPGFKKLSDVVTKALGGDDKALHKLEKIGVDIETLRGKNPEQIFLTLAGAIAKIEDPLARNAALTSTFGKAGMSLVPILGEVATGFAESGKRAEELGLVFSSEAMASASALDDSFDDLSATMAGFSRTLATTFNGPLKDTIVVLTDTLGAFNTWWQGIDAGTKKVVLIFAGAFAASGPIIAVIGAFMVAVSAGLGPLMVGGAIVTGLAASVAAIIANWDSIKAKASAIWTAVRDGVVNSVKGIYDGVKSWMVDKLMAIIAPIKNFTTDVLDAFKWLRNELVGHSEVPDMVEEIGDHMRMLDKNMVAPARTATRGTFMAFRDLVGQVSTEMATISNTMISTWGNVTSTMSNALAQQIIKGNDWKATMESLATSVLSSMINLGVQMTTQWLLREVMFASLMASHGAVSMAAATAEVATNTTKNAALLASDAATSGGIISIWTATSAAVTGAFGMMTGAIATFFTATIIPMFAAVGEAVMTFLAAIATSLDISIFGAPFSIPVWAAVGVIAAAVGVLSAFAFGAFAEGGIITKPTMALMGEAGPEAVIPLSKLGKLNGGGQTTVVVELDGRTLARSVFDNMPSVMRVRGVSA